MSKIPAIIILFIALATGCKPRTKQTAFVQQHALQQYDSIFLVSGASCSGCIADFFKEKKARQTSVYLFDTTYETPFLRALRRFPHQHVAQQELDEYFDNFGNVIILYRSDTGYVRIDYEDIPLPS